MHTINPALLRSHINVTVVGAGGNGSQILVGLARLNQAMLALGHPYGLNVLAVDDDLVSPFNVGRQLFFPADIGFAKVSVLINRINLCYGTRWAACQSKVSGEHLNCDIVIGCVDNRRARRTIFDHLSDAHDHIYWLDLGNNSDTGQCILGENTACLDEQIRLPHAADLFPELVDTSIPEVDEPSCSMAESLSKQSLFINQGIALPALNLLWQCFRHGKIQHHGCFIDLKSNRMSSLPIDPNAWKRFGFTPT